MAWTSTPTVCIYAKYNNYDILIVSVHYGRDKYTSVTVVFIYAKYNNYDILSVSAHYGMDKYAYCCFYLRLV